MDENDCLPIAPTRISNDLPRALTEFGQQGEGRSGHKSIFDSFIMAFRQAFAESARWESDPPSSYQLRRFQNARLSRALR